MPENIVRLDVAGAWELPWGASRLIQAGCQGVVATAVVLQGETHHFRSVVEGAVQGLIHLQVETGVPVGNAVLAVSDWEQAVARSEPGANAGRPGRPGSGGGAPVGDHMSLGNALG